ncbi:MAG: tyrosine-type recombinase/integrase [Proteobacteria bacterium]|nr:tyrosine-type recombinase/integrase [Pseudomonadota bacterium]
MAALAYRKRGKNTYVYIVNNFTEYVNGKAKYKQKNVKSLGVLGKNITKSQAKIELSKYELGDFATETSDDITLRQLIDEFLPIHKEDVYPGGVALETYKMCVKHTAKLDFLLDMKIKEIKYKHIQKFKNDYKKTVSNRYVNLALIELKRVLKYAIKIEYIDNLPIIEALKTQQKDPISLTKEELMSIISHSSGNIKFYILMMCHTGMRPNELFKLMWGDIDFDRRLLEIKSDNPLKFGRVIPIDETIVDILRNRFYKLTGKTSTLSLPDLRVCPFENSHSANWGLLRLGKKLDIHVNPYKLRKTYISLMNDSGANTFELCRLVGHKDPKTTNRSYLDISDTRLRGELSKNPMMDLHESGKNSGN